MSPVENEIADAKCARRTRHQRVAIMNCLLSVLIRSQPVVLLALKEGSGTERHCSQQVARRQPTASTASIKFLERSMEVTVRNKK